MIDGLYIENGFRVPRKLRPINEENQNIKSQSKAQSLGNHLNTDAHHTPHYAFVNNCWVN